MTTPHEPTPTVDQYRAARHAAADGDTDVDAHRAARHTPTSDPAVDQYRRPAGTERNAP